MYRTIVPLIGSPHDEAVLGIARTLAATEHGEADLVHVLGPEPRQHEPRAARTNAAEMYLSSIAETFPESAIVRTHVRSGLPVPCIQEVAATSNSNVLILAPRWSEDRQGFEPDSTSRELIDALRIPTIMVPGGANASVGRLRTVLLPINHARVDAGLDAIEWLMPLNPFLRLVSIAAMTRQANGYGSSAHVFQQERNEPDIEDHRSALLRLSRYLSHKGIRSNWEVRFGSAVHEILRTSDTTETDLIVFTPPHPDEGALARIGASALSVARHSRVPVLLFPGDVGPDTPAVSDRRQPAET